MNFIDEKEIIVKGSFAAWLCFVFFSHKNTFQIIRDLDKVKVGNLIKKQQNFFIINRIIYPISTSQFYPSTLFPPSFFSFIPLLSTIPMNLLSLTSILLFLLHVHSWNQRTTCKANNLSKNQRFRNWVFAKLFSKTLSEKLFKKMMSHLAFSGHHGMPIVNSSLSPCQNFLMHEQSCCNQQSLDGLFQTINEFYDTDLELVRYPIQQYLYDFYNQTKRNNCKPFPLFRIPGVDGYTHQNSTKSFSQLLKQYEHHIEEIRKHEKKFINETICIMCIGVKDIPNYVYPVSENFNGFIINRQYFIDKVQLITTHFLALENLHEKLRIQIRDAARRITTSSTACFRIQSQAVTTSFYESLRLCKSESSCKKLSVLYFGSVAAPQYLRYIQAKSRRKNLSPISFKIYLGLQDFGFMANITQSPLYGIKTIPNVAKCQREKCDELWKNN